MVLSYNLVPQTAFNLRFALLILFSISIFVILLGTGLNNLDHKYIRALPHESCAHQILNIHVRNSFLCCDKNFRYLDWICIASYDNTNKILSSTYALIIPFSLTLTTFTVEFLSHLFTYGLSTKKVASGNFLLLMKSSVSRLLIVLLLLFLRTIVLYKGLGTVERAIQTWYNTDSALGGTECWYSAYLKDEQCRDNFDFSDHIVLYLVHYIAPVALELAAIRSKIQARHLLQQQQVSSSGSYISGTVLYLAPVLLALSLYVLTLRGVWFTSLYFHTQMENLIAVAVATVFVALPLSALAGSLMWLTAAHGTNLRDIK